MIAGTWSINQVISDDLPTPDIFMSSVFPGDRYLAIESSATSASNLEWFVSEFFQAEKYAAPVLDRKVFDYCNELVQQVQLNENLPIYHPYLYGSKDNAHLGANFFGVSGWHTRADLLYAVYEGIVFGHQEHVDKLARFGITFDHVVLGGGGSRSNVLVPTVCRHIKYYRQCDALCGNRCSWCGNGRGNGCGFVCKL